MPPTRPAQRMRASRTRAGRARDNSCRAARATGEFGEAAARATGGTPAPRNTKVAPNARQVSTEEAPEYRSEVRTSRGTCGVTGGGAALALAHWFGEKPHAALAVRGVVTIEDGYRGRVPHPPQVEGT